MCSVSDKEAWFDRKYTDNNGLCEKLAGNTNVTLPGSDVSRTSANYFLDLGFGQLEN